MSLSSVLCICVAACMFPAIFALSQHQQELKEHYEHLNSIASFECKAPQPRLLHVWDLLLEHQIQDKAFFPEVSVLHRCDRHVGSCNDASYWCGPTHVINVTMPFKVTFLEDMDGHKKGQWEMEYHSLENHTDCGCLKHVEQPPKTIMHYHYVDPSLTSPPKTSSQLEQNYTLPSISDMTQIAEKEVSRCNVVSNKPPEEESNQCSSCTTPNEEIDSFTTPTVTSTTDDTYYDDTSYVKQAFP